MIRVTRLLAFPFLATFSAAASYAQTGTTATCITPEQIDAHLCFLSSDLLEGRADVVKADPKTIKITASGKANASIGFTHDVVVWPGSATDASSARNPRVAHGMALPE
jgi:hypothetical protein